MTRIDANVATHLADAGRVPQKELDRQLQDQEVRIGEIASPEAASSGPVDAEEVKAAAAQLQKVIEGASNRALSFRLYEDQSLFLEIRDRNSNEVIKQIPAESVLELSSRLDDLVGALVNESV